jgi:hypothetical protein
MLALSAERAIQRVLVVARACLTHAFSLNNPAGTTSAIYMPAFNGVSLNCHKQGELSSINATQSSMRRQS